MTMAASYPFVIADVFTETTYGGNQLAVLPDARGLSDRQMQRIAREFNFAESTFVFPPDDRANTARVRIFTPRAELPFAGHPTVGTAAVIFSRRGSATPATLVLEEQIGPVRVDVMPRGAGYSSTLRLEGGVEVAPLDVAHAALAHVLSLPEDLVREAWFASVGTRFCLVHVATKHAVDAAVLDRAAWQMHLSPAWSSNVFLFSGEPRRDRSLYARMFAPALGIEEDPASGSAIAALVASLAARDPSAGDVEVQVAQGVQLGRPSTIHAVARCRDGRVTIVEVSGTTIVVARGEIDAPADAAG
jgi:trans-2,3-dihydro-3-hydroxyanthranilate isomerase